MSDGVEIRVGGERPARDRISRRARILVVVAVAAVLLGGLAIDIAGAGISNDSIAFIPIALAFYLVGTLLVMRVPQNRLSWVMLGIALGLGFMSLSVLLQGIGLWGLFLPGLGVLVPLWFPTGEPPSARWRWVGWLALAGVVGILGGSAYVGLVEKGDLETVGSCVSIGTCSSILGLGVILVAVVGAIASLIVRWKRAQGVERLQLRWLLPSFFVLGGGLLAEFGGFQGSWAANVLLPAGAMLVPVAIGVAVLRYRLYEIDRIVSRTVSYTLVVGLLALLYVGGVTWLTTLLPDQSELVVAATTLAVATLFNPVRRRVQNWVDRRFNRSRYDTQRVMDAFTGSLRDQVDPDGVVEGWVGAVADTMQPSTVGVWVREAGI